MSYWFFWLAVIIFLTAIEISTVNLVSVWFIISVIFTLLLSFFIKNFYIQFIIFVILGIILLIFTRKFVDKILKNKNVCTNLDRVLGMKGIVTKPIRPNKRGEVKVDGKYWSAISKESLEVDALVFIEKIDGVKLVVRKDDGNV